MLYASLMLSPPLIRHKTAGPQPRHPFLLVFGLRELYAVGIGQLPFVVLGQPREPSLRLGVADKRSLAEDRQLLVRAR